MVGRDVQSIVGRYPPGERVMVAVNPTDASDSVLIAGLDADSVIPLVLGLFLMLLGLGDVQKQSTAAAPAIPMLTPPRYRLAWILGVIGAGLILFGVIALYQGIASEGWPSVGGKIMYSHARTGRNAETLLWYEYRVGDQRYVSSKYRTGGNGTPFRKVAEETAKRYPAGQVVKVYYNPHNPAEALLEPGIWWDNFAAPVMGLLILGAAWLAKKYAEAVAWRRRR
jgi:hypothetical protein